MTSSEPKMTRKEWAIITSICVIIIAIFTCIWIYAPSHDCIEREYGNDDPMAGGTFSKYCEPAKIIEGPEYRRQRR